MSTKVVASFLIRPVWDFQGDMGSLEEILLYLGAEITFISEHHAIDIPIGHRWGGGCHGHLPSSCQRNGRHNLFCRQRAAYIHSNATLARRNSPSLEWRCCYHVPWYNVLPLRFGRPWSAWSRYRTHPRSHVLSDLFARHAVCLRLALNCRQLIRFDKSSLHSLCSRWNRRFSLSKPNASAVMPRITTSRSENLDTTPHLGTFSRSLIRSISCEILADSDEI